MFRRNISTERATRTPGGPSITTPKHHLCISSCALTTLTLWALIGCNQGDPIIPSTDSEIEDRFHEKSFSWTNPDATPELAKTSSLVTEFGTTTQWGEAIRALNDSLSTPGFSKNLWKPIDQACDELTLALWNTYGTVRVADSIVLSESIVRHGCIDVASDQPLAKAGAFAAYPSVEVDHRVYPYKMIGRSWDNYDMVVYKSTGAETQFKKHRTKVFVTAWWDTDATRIGVRTYLLNCGVTGSGTIGTRTCLSGGMRTASAGNDDYVSQRDFSAGLLLTYTFPSTVSASPTKLKVSDAVIGMHSVDHAGIAFRASSSSGLTNATVLTMMPPLEYVTW
jgi:hypothetical protein